MSDLVRKVSHRQFFSYCLCLVLILSCMLFMSLLDQDQTSVYASELTPSETTDPTDPAASGETTDPTEPSETGETDPTEPAATGETTEPTDPAEPAALGETTDPTDPAASGETTEPTEPAEPAALGETTDPTDPAASGETTDPTDPADPGEPDIIEEPLASPAMSMILVTEETEPVDPTADHTAYFVEGDQAFTNTYSTNAIQQAVDAALAYALENASQELTITVRDGSYVGGLVIDQTITGTLSGNLTLSILAHDSGDDRLSSAGGADLDGDIFISYADLQIILAGIYLSSGKSTITAVKSPSLTVFGTVLDDTITLNINGQQTAALYGGGGQDKLTMTSAGYNYDAQAPPAGVTTAIVDGGDGDDLLTISTNLAFANGTVTASVQGGTDLDQLNLTGTLDDILMPNMTRTAEGITLQAMAITSLFGVWQIDPLRNTLFIDLLDANIAIYTDDLLNMNEDDRESAKEVGEDAATLDGDGELAVSLSEPVWGYLFHIDSRDPLAGTTIKLGSGESAITTEYGSFSFGQSVPDQYVLQIYNAVLVTAGAYIYIDPQHGEVIVAANLLAPGEDIFIIGKNITVSEGVIISTRMPQQEDHLNDDSVGHSGSITFYANNILIKKDARLLTFVKGDAFLAGDIILLATGRLETTPVSYSVPVEDEENMDVGENASISLMGFWGANDPITITIESGVAIWAHADGFNAAAGDITLSATQIAGTGWDDILFYHLDESKVKITIDSAEIKGKDVKFTAEADHTSLYWENENADEKDMWNKLEEKTIETGNWLLENFNLFGGWAESNTEAIINIKAGSSIEASSFEAAAISTSQAISQAISWGIGVAVGKINSNTQVIVAGSIETTGDCFIWVSSVNSLRAEANSGSISGVASAVAVTILNSYTSAWITETAEMDVGGNLSVKAETIDRNITLARSASGKDGFVGLAVAYSQEDSTTEAFLDGKAAVGGNITVFASHKKEFEIENKLVTGVTAAAGVGTDSKGDLDPMSLLTDRITGIVNNAAIKLWNSIKNYLVTPKDGDQVSQTPKPKPEFAPAIAVHMDENRVTARIGNPESTQQVAITAKGDITVRAVVFSEPCVSARSSIVEPASAPTEAGSGDDKTKLAFSAAIVVGVYNNSAVAFIAGNVRLDSVGLLLVQAEVINQYDADYGKNILEAVGSPARYDSSDGAVDIDKGDIVIILDDYAAGGAAGHLYEYLGNLTEINLSAADYSNESEWKDLGPDWLYWAIRVYATLGLYLDENLGLRNNLVNTWSQSTAAGAEWSLAGAITYLDQINQALAYIDSGAQINQTDHADFRSGSQTIQVSSRIVDQSVHFGGNIRLPVSGEKKTFTLVSPVVSGEEAIGGTLLLIYHSNTAKAEIRDRVNLFADSLQVTADTEVMNITVAASGGKAGTFGFSGTGTYINIRNVTYAGINSDARVVVGTVPVGDTGASIYISAKDKTLIVNAGGGVAVAENYGIGVSVSVNNISRDTQAFIGAPVENPAQVIVKPLSGQRTIQTPGSLLIEAENSGWIGSFSLAAAIAYDAGNDSDPQDAKDAPEGGGKFGISVSGDVSVNLLDDKALAHIRDAVLAVKDIKLAAENDTFILAVSGSAAVITKEKTSAGIAGSVSWNTAALQSASWIENSDLLLSGNLDVLAVSKGKIIAIAASGSGAPRQQGIAIAGQVSINAIYSVTLAAIKDGSSVEAVYVRLRAEDHSKILSIAGALAYGGKAGIGASVALNQMPLHGRGSTSAYVSDSDIEAVMVDLSAKTIKKIMAVTAALAGAKDGMAAAISCSINTIDHDTEVFIHAMNIKGINSTQGVSLTASDQSEIVSIAGAIGVAYSGKAGFGIAVAYNDIDSHVKAELSETKVVADSLNLLAKREASIQNITAGGAGAQTFALGGSVSINYIEGSAVAEISGSQVTAIHLISLSAQDNSYIGVIAGAVGGAKEAAVGVAVALNHIGSEAAPLKVHAALKDSGVKSLQGSVLLDASSTSIVENISAAGAMAGKAAITGALSWNWVYTDIAAFIADCSGDDGKWVKARQDISLTAADHIHVSIIVGNIAGAGKGGIGAAVGIVFIGNADTQGHNPLADNQIVDQPNGNELDPAAGPDPADPAANQVNFRDTSKVRAEIINSKVIASEGSVILTATDNSVIFNVSAGIAGGGFLGIQGSFAYNHINKGAIARNHTSQVYAGQDILLTARFIREAVPGAILSVDDSIWSGAGSLAGGGKAGVGGAVALNRIENEVTTAVTDSQLNASRLVNLTSESDVSIQTVSAAVAGAGYLAAAFSVSLNWIEIDIAAYSKNSEISAENIYIKTEDLSLIDSLSGGLSGTGGVGLGGAAAYNDIQNNVQSYIDSCKISTADSVIILAVSEAEINTIAAGGSLAGAVGGSGTVAINNMKNQVKASITDSAVAAGNNVYLLADARNGISSYGGSLGAGVAVGFGAAIVINDIQNLTQASICSSSVLAAGEGDPVQIILWDEDGAESREEANGLILIARNLEEVTVYTGSAGLGTVGIGILGSINVISNTTEAYIKNSTINSTEDPGTRVILRALHATGLRVYGGTIAAGIGALGVALDWTSAKQKTSSIVEASQIYAGNGLEVLSMSVFEPLGDDEPSLIIAGIVGSKALSIAGAVSILTVENHSQAEIRDSLVYSPGGSIRVHSRNNVAADVWAGTISGSVFFGAGGSVVATSFKNASRASVKGSALNARDAIEIMASSRENITVTAGTLGLSGGLGVAGAIIITLVENTTEASIERGFDKNAVINQDPGYQGYGSDQTLLVRADSKTDIDNTGGALGFGLLAVGLGATIDYINIQNRTAAWIGEGSHIYASGDIKIEAEANKKAASDVYAFGGGLFGLSGAVSIIHINAVMDELASTEVNPDLLNQLDQDLSMASFLYYKGDDGNLYSRLPEDSIAAKAALAVAGLLAPNLENAIKGSEEAAIGTFAYFEGANSFDSRIQLVSAADVVVNALSTYDLVSESGTLAVGIGGGLGASVAGINVQETTRAYIGDHGFVRARNLSLSAASFFDKAEAISAAAEFGLFTLKDNSAAAALSPTVESFLGKHADVQTVSDLTVMAQSIAGPYARAKGILTIGGVAIGASRAQAYLIANVSAYINENARIEAGRDIIITAAHNVLPDGSVVDVQTKALANASSGALLWTDTGVEVLVLHVAQVNAFVSSGTKISAGQDFNLAAYNYFAAAADGNVDSYGIVGSGDVDVTAVACGSVMAFLDSAADHPIELTAVRDITLKSQSYGTTAAEASASTAGLAADGTSTAKTSLTNSSHVRTGSGTRLSAGNDLTVIADAASDIQKTKVIGGSDGGYGETDTTAEAALFHRALAVVESGAVLTAANSIRILASSSIEVDAYAKVDNSIGGYTRNFAVSRVDVNALTQADIEQNVYIAGKNISIQAIVGKLIITSYGHTKTYALDSISEAKTFLNVVSLAKVVAAGAEVNGSQRLEIRAMHEDVQTKSHSYSEIGGGVVGTITSIASSNLDIYSHVDIQPGSRLSSNEIILEAVSPDDWKAEAQNMYVKTAQVESSTLVNWVQGGFEIIGYTLVTVVDKITSWMPWPFKNIVRWITSQVLVPIKAIIWILEKAETVTFETPGEIRSTNLVNLQGEIYLGGSRGMTLTIHPDGLIESTGGFSAALIGTDIVVTLDGFSGEQLGLLTINSPMGDVTGDAVIYKDGVYSYVNIINNSKYNLLIHNISLYNSDLEQPDIIIVAAEDGNKTHFTYDTTFIDIPEIEITSTNAADIVFAGLVKNPTGKTTVDAGSGNIYFLPGSALEANVLILIGRHIGQSTENRALLYLYKDEGRNPLLSVTAAGDAYLDVRLREFSENINGGPIDALTLSELTAAGTLDLVASRPQLWYIDEDGYIVLIDVSGVFLADGISAGEALHLAVAGTMIVTKDLTACSDIVLTTVDYPGQGEDIIVRAGVSIRSANGSITLRAGDNIMLEAGSILTAARTVTLLGDYGNADPGFGTTINVYGIIEASSIRIEGNSDADTFNLITDTFTCPVEVYGIDGDNVFTLKLKSYSAPIAMYGGNGNDTFYVYDLPSLRGVPKVTMDGGGGFNTYHSTIKDITQTRHDKPSKVTVKKA